jgi:co-chaperonin GroES (HSP10)
MSITDDNLIQEEKWKEAKVRAFKKRSWPLLSELEEDGPQADIDYDDICSVSLADLEQQWGIISDQTALRPIGDRILVLEDEFKSRYDCTACKGTGHTEEVCPYCLGTKRFKGKKDTDEICPDCTVTGELNKTFGKVICPICKGRQGTIVVPDDSKKRPTTGKIIAVGSLVTEFNVGDNILFTNYTGQDFEVDGFKLRIMRQHDVYCQRKALNKNKTSESVQVDENSRTDPDNVGQV